jgi:regulator of sigma D
MTLNTRPASRFSQVKKNWMTPNQIVNRHDHRRRSMMPRFSNLVEINATGAGA